MGEGFEERAARLRDYFGLSRDAELLTDGVKFPQPDRKVEEHLTRFNIEWHIIPSQKAVPFDDAYAARLYPRCARSFTSPGYHSASCRDALATGHRRHQGQVVGVETTMKPGYLPENRQYYGTRYGFDATADPFSLYLGRAGFVTSTRYDHNYASLREYVNIVNADWREKGLMPAGYRLTVCPPAVFNLIGNLFRPEWSETEALELGFYRDDHGNAKCYAVGSNGPGDFSFIHEIETNSDWALLGFRNALVPDV